MLTLGTRVYKEMLCVSDDIPKVMKEKRQQKTAQSDATRRTSCAKPARENLTQRGVITV